LKSWLQQLLNDNTPEPDREEGNEHELICAVLLREAGGQS
jgi:hypothetical protein